MQHFQVRLLSRKSPLTRAIGLALGLLVTSVPAAFAQTNKQAAERAREAEIAFNIEQAAKLVSGYGLACEIVEASAPRSADGVVGGKLVRLNITEIACKNQRGFLLYESKGQPFGDPVDCLQALAQNKADQGNQACALRGNRVMHYWLGETASASIPGCKIGGARFISRDKAGQSEVYEIACKGMAGGIFTLPGYKSKETAVSVLPCLKTADTALKCELTPPDQQPLALSGLIKKHAPSCVMSNARFIGSAKESDYYEVGCTGAAGFILETDANRVFKSRFGCDQAAAIGGCKFTDASLVAEAQKAAEDEAKAKKAQALAQARAKQLTGYQEALTNASVTCTVADFRRVGRDNATSRDLVEFSCPEAANGLMALVPDAGSTGKLDTFDCFTGASQQMDCSFTPRAKLLERLQALAVGHKSINADCVLSDVRFAFENNGQAVLELACANQRGYIAVLDKARAALKPVVACHVAATNPNVPEKCTISGNGSNREGM